MTEPRWSDAEIDFILRYPDMAISDVASTLGRTYNAVMFRRALLVRSGRLDSKRKRYTTRDDSHILTCDACGMETDHVATALGRTPMAVYQRLRELKRRGFQ